MTAEPQSRFTFPEPTDERRAIVYRIIELMRDGQRRSKAEIREALGLGPDVEIGARIRDARKPEYGAWAISDARAAGPDPDGIYRYELAKPLRRVQ